MRIPLYLIGLLVLIGSCNRKPSTEFTLMSASDTGINFQNNLRETEEFNVLQYTYLYNGGGVAIGDVNNDGLPDIYFTGNMVGSHLYLNEGDFHFKDIAKEAGVFAEGLWNTGTTMADVNGDGLLDIYVCRSAAKDPSKRKNLLFINNGDLTFSEKAYEYGVDDSGYTTQGTFFDYDNDGDLDLYVLNHSTHEYAGFDQSTLLYKNRKNPAYSDRLYENVDGHFRDVSAQAGLVSNVLGFGLQVSVSDINNDGWQDIYVTNDFNEQDYLYINNKNGTFTESLAEMMGHISFFSMGCDIADINNDGDMDLFTLDMLPEDNFRQKMVSGPDNFEKHALLAKNGFYNQTMRNMLHLNNHGKSFTEIGQFAGVSNTDWSWAGLFTDLDNDGFKDLVVTNGYRRDYTSMDVMNYAMKKRMEESKTGKQETILEFLEHVPPTLVPNYTFKNNGDLTFSNVGVQWGMDQKSLSNGAAYADLDNDGDMDLVVNNIDGKAFVYRNNSETFDQNNYLRIQLKGQGKNRFGVGAKVTVEAGGKTLTQEQMPTRGYQSSVDYTLVFGVGKDSVVDQVTVTWPNGKQQRVKAQAVNQTLVVDQNAAQMVPPVQRAVPKPYFVPMEEASTLEYVQTENPYNDFKKEPLLPHLLSTQGPKMARADVNGDGLDDVFFGGAKGIPGKLFMQTSNSTFALSDQAVFDGDALSEDTGVLFFDADGDGDADLYVVSGGNDSAANAPELQDRLYLNNGKGQFSKAVDQLPQMMASGSCVKASDVDGDGDLDLFVGGRVLPGSYPKASRSYVLENDGKGYFSDVTEKRNPELMLPGMVTDAVWTDFNGDHKEDLILVGEFMGVRLFENKGNNFVELSGPEGLENSQGWWNTIAAADLDGDGDMDYMLGNLGLNSQLKASPSEPVRLYNKDFDGNGSLDAVLCSYIQGENYPIYSKDDLTAQLPGIQTQYPNYSDYATQKITDIFKEADLKSAQTLQATNFQSSYLENRGDGTFKLIALPAAAQWSPINAIHIEDIDGDGHLDALLAGNFFGARAKFGRYDANTGLVLLGNGKGQFKAMDAEQSGFHINGEVRDIQEVKLANGTQALLFARNQEAVALYQKN